MDIRLYVQNGVISSSLQISGSKSETNRLLLLQGLYPEISFLNASESDDSKAMRKALTGNNGIVDVHHAGTAMRFLTAYYAICEGREVVLTGSLRMKERPISELVEALQSLGADIHYMENEGYPPLRIKGKKITGAKVAVKANVSSQYISALLLIAAKLENGLEIELDGEITSRPYLDMTLSLLKQVGVTAVFNNNVIKVSSATNNLQPINVAIESDWSSASYFYSVIALAEIGATISLSSYKKNSLQGDSALIDIYKKFGVTTEFINDTITLKKVSSERSAISLDLNSTPDIAQTIAVTCLGLETGCKLSGLHTLKIKETDRLEALKTELEKFGVSVNITNDSLAFEPNTLDLKNTPTIKIATYNDHRMAMAFAPLAVKLPIIIKDAEVVSKSYPEFWNDLAKIGFSSNVI